MSYTIRVSLPTYNALTDSDPDHYALYTNSDWVLIKEKARGSVEIEAYGSAEINHSLGYCPHFYAYGEVSSGRFSVINGYNLFGDFTTYVSESSLHINSGIGSAVDARYYIFYDKMT